MTDAAKIEVLWTVVEAAIAERHLHANAPGSDRYDAALAAYDKAVREFCQQPADSVPHCTSQASS